MPTSNDFISEQEKLFIQKLRSIAEQYDIDESLIVESLKNPPSEVLSRSQKISDKVARFGGSWLFIISFIVLLIIWIGINIIFPEKLRFDPYPFILMNLLLSCIAAFQAPIIMMSQNRQDDKDRKQAESDYLVNLKAELETRTLNKKMDILVNEQLDVLIRTQEEQLALLQDIREKLARL